MTAAVANAQAVSSASLSADQWSSSQDGMQLAKASAPANPALPAAPEPAGAARAQDQDNNTYSGWGAHDVMHRMTIMFGGGAAAPAGDKQYITWGGGFQMGAGVNFSEHFATLLEYQFLDNKVPGKIIAEAGTSGGKYHIWSFGLSPVYDIWPKNGNDLYLVGGYGFYRKTTNFTVLSPQQFCTYFYYCGTGYAPQTVGKLSSNQGGFNIGAGYQHRFGGMYGESKTRFFAEVRYLDVQSPAVVGKAPSGGLAPVSIAAGTKLLPIMLGIRW